MAAFLITYDLNRPGQNYPQLYKAIERLGGWWHHIESNWIVISSDTAAQIRDTIAKYIDFNDKLLVAKLSGDAAWQGFSTEGSEWLKDNLL